MPDPAATDSAKRNAEQLVLEQHLKGMKENERRAGPKRLETVVADRSGPESRGGDDNNVTAAAASANADAGDSGD